MSERTGVGVVELAILEALDSLNARARTLCRLTPYRSATSVTGTSSRARAARRRCRPSRPTALDPGAGMPGQP